ncbi:MAG TPA: ABC transporter substrate-binding protein [Candidatus Dormibacteraeota bacterium]|nr:ABC transporter substrate-binding protein [Candidatus Dormibacteraeota bacterium]
MPTWRGVSELDSPIPREDALDPQVNTWLDSAELFRCCLLRTLYSYTGRPARDGGAELRPDLAVGMPEVSADGLNWTFRIRTGVKYAPPIGREIVAADFVRSMQREARIPNGQAWLYSVITGFDQYRDGQTSTISGLETPDRHTLRVRLNQVAGDLPYRFSLSNSAPVPPSFDGTAPYGVATGHDTGYGKFLVASGPYMVEGSPQLNFRAPADRQHPLSGFAPSASLILVRNPLWNSASDPLRPAYVDEIRITIGMSRDTAAQLWERSQVDLVWLPSPPFQVQSWLVDKVRADPKLGRVHVNSRDTLRYISMNLAVPPFDDIHVRKAVNYVINKRALVDAYGGDLAAQIATHIAPDSLENNALSDYDPYGTPGDQGSLDRAIQEMRQSRYDLDHTGTCSAAVCKHVLALTINSPANDAGPSFFNMAALVADDLSKIGIRLDVQSPAGLVLRLAGDPVSRVPLVVTLSAGKYYSNASSVFAGGFAFATSGTASTGCRPWCRHTLVGATTNQLRQWGYWVSTVPSVDDRIRECMLGGQLQSRCWTALDIYLMEKVVPIAPYAQENVVQVIPPRVVNYSFDQFANSPALDQIAVRPN